VDNFPAVRRVSGLSVTPVKGLALHHPRELRMTTAGVAENRRFFLVDTRGRLVSGLHHGPLVSLRADYDETAERLAISFPDDRTIAGEVSLGEAVETDFWRTRVVTGRLVEGPWAEAISAFAGRELRLVKATSGGGGYDVQPVTLLSTASVAELERRAGQGGIGAERFRMLVEIDGCEPHEEDTWAGCDIRLGDATVRVLGPVARCATTTRDPATGIRDIDVLAAIRNYRGLRERRRIDFGVYAEVREPGAVRVGDPVEPA